MILCEIHVQVSLQSAVIGEYPTGEGKGVWRVAILFKFLQGESAVMIQVCFSQYILGEELVTFNPHDVFKIGHLLVGMSTSVTQLVVVYRGGTWIDCIEQL